MCSVQVKQSQVFQPNVYSSDNLHLLACVIVTFHPDLQVLKRQLDALPAPATVILVDNASAGGVGEALRCFVGERERTYLVVNDDNVGLAAAINQGVRQIKKKCSEIRFVLLLDQDSEPAPGSVETLMKKIVELKKAVPPVGCVGPTLLDPVTGLNHGFHRCSGMFWTRIYPDSGSALPVSCANLNGSGTLVSLDLFLELGGLEEALFIDHVDTEWSFRVQAAGYVLFGIPQAHFIHRMGDDSRRIWLLGWRMWPMRSPQRHYYLFRNAVILMRRNYVPGVWKIWAIIKLMLTAVVHILIDCQRIAQINSMFKGVCDGMKAGKSLEGGRDLQ